MHTVDILLFDDVDEIDFSAPYEILSSCRQIVDGHRSDKPAFLVETVAEHRSPVRCANGLSVIPNRIFEQGRESDIVIVPGGPGARRNPLPLKMTEFLMRSADTADVVASVCTGAFVLCATGIMDGRNVTTHHARLADLQTQFPKVKVVHGQRLVSDNGGHFMSSGGIICGVDLALALIARFEGRDAAAVAANRLEWPVALPMAPFRAAAAPVATHA